MLKHKKNKGESEFYLTGIDDLDGDKAEGDLGEEAMGYDLFYSNGDRHKENPR